MRTVILAVAMLLLCSVAFGDQFVEKKVVAAIDADGVQQVAMTAGEYYFDPKEVVVKVNVPVELDVKKTAGVAPHNISLKAPEAGIDFSEELSSSEAKVIKFTPTKVGTYSFECTHRFMFFKSHADRGMQGVLVVVP